LKGLKSSGLKSKNSTVELITIIFVNSPFDSFGYFIGLKEVAAVSEIFDLGESESWYFYLLKR
jgi:hypothetical protein